MVTLKKASSRTFSQTKLKPVHQFQFILYALFVMLCLLLAAASIILAARLI